MPRGQPFARIAITLPAEDLAAADKLAVEQDRSRSWIVSEAVRHYVAAQRREAGAPTLDASRREQLRRDLALSPTDRIRAAEEGVHLASSHSAAVQEPITFASFDAFLRWSRAHPIAK